MLKILTNERQKVKLKNECWKIVGEVERRKCEAEKVV